MAAVATADSLFQTYFPLHSQFALEFIPRAGPLKFPAEETKMQKNGLDSEIY